MMIETDINLLLNLDWIYQSILRKVCELTRTRVLYVNYQK